MAGRQAFGRLRARVPHGRLERLSAAVTRASDRVLDFLVLAFAAWTVVYHACVVLRLGAVWALVASAIALFPCGWLAFRRADVDVEEPRRPAPARSGRLVFALYASAAFVVAALFAFSDLPWVVVWIALAGAGAAGLVLATRRVQGRALLDPGDEPGTGMPSSGAGRRWPATLVAVAWALALGTVSLFLVRPAADDAYYGRLSSWIAVHGRFPVRDVLFSDEVFPAVIYPPLASFEALVGTAGYLTGFAVPNLLYLGVTPLASVLSVLAIWRLLRRWGTAMVGLALSATFVFLLLDAQSHRTFGNLFIGRIWEGKITFLAVLVPLLFVMLSEYAERPTARRLVFLGAAGVAGVGLTSSATFLVPIIAAGCLAPLAVRAPRRALLGFAAVAAYPLGAFAVRAALGGRRAAHDTASNVVAGNLVHFVLGTGTVALVAVTAMLVGPLLIRRAAAAQMTAGAALLVICLYAPPVPRLVWEVSGIGRVLWRLNWAAPTAVLVGVLATGLAAQVRSPALRALPAVVLSAVLVAAGRPLWETAKPAGKPSWKIPAGDVSAARRILSHARPGDVILAPQKVSQAIVIMSGRVTTVAPRIFYARALSGTPAAHAEGRVLLESFSELGLGAPVLRMRGRTTEPGAVVRALHAVGVDLACVFEHEGVRALLAKAGYSPLFRGKTIACLRGPAAD